MLAHAGVGSRRACEDFILQGRITINGEVVRELGTKVLAGRDRVAVDGQPIHDERPAYIAVNKPKGYVSTNSDPSGRPRVIDLAPDIPQRLYTVGRLDEMSTGLLLLTNDGELANKLAHPKFGVEKVYRAVVAGNPSPEVLKKLTEGIWLAEGKVRAKRVKPLANKGDATVLEMVLAEGKNREVRRMLAKLGHKVMTLTRVAVGPITLKGLKPGGWRFLTSNEVDLLRKVADGMPVPAGRFGADRPARPPQRGPRAYQGEGAGSRSPRDRNEGPPQRGPRPHQAQGGFSSQGPRDRHEGPMPRGPRPIQGGPPQHDRRPPRRDEGPVQRPRLAQTGDGGPARGPGPGGARRGPARPGQSGPFNPPPRVEPPTRRIIGLNLGAAESESEPRRPMPRRRPAGPPAPRRRPGAKPRRPGDESGE